MAGSTGAAKDPMIEHFFADLKIEEGFRDRPYRDAEGFLTIGYGWNLDAVPMPETVAAVMLAYQVGAAAKALDDHLPWWRGLDRVRGHVLIDMVFNMGIGRSPGDPNGAAGLLSFHNTLEDIRTGHYDEAADGMLRSLWARQVKGRAQRLAQMMRTGEYIPLAPAPSGGTKSSRK